MGFPVCSVGKESGCNTEDAGDTGSVPGLGRSPGGGRDNPLQYSCQENPIERSLERSSHWDRRESDTTIVTWHAFTQYPIFLINYSFIWLHQVLDVEGEFFYLSCGLGVLSLQHGGSSSLTRGRTLTPCIGAQS